VNNVTSHRSFPSLVGDVLGQPGHYVDNIFAIAWKGLNLSKLIEKAGFKKRTGVPVTEAIFLLMLWKWINVSSIAVFCRQSLSTFSGAKKDVMYDLLKREDADWRSLNSQTAKAVYQGCDIASSRLKVFVLDDTMKGRRGKKMEGVSCHFDHTEGRYIMGQQVLTLGLATGDHFMPLDSQIYISQSKPQGLIREFDDARSVTAKRYQEATTQSKPDMAKAMLARALRQNIQADYLAADAWFGTKATIQTAQSLSLVAVLRMKKNKTKYRLADEKGRTLDLDAQSLYQRAVKGEWKKVHNMPYRAATLDVDLDIASEEQKKSQWIKVRLLFVRGAEEDEKPSVGKKDWALFLTTDPDMSLTRTLEVYALRWGIEVYFKEAKQHLGFLQEQTQTFASHTASIHLTAIRYLLLVYAQHENEALRVCDIRSRLQDQLTSLDYAKNLWGIFRTLIHDALGDINREIGGAAGTVMKAIDSRVHDFFVRSLQLDAFTLEMEFK
jgi:SRSO17 transposase